LVFLGKKLLNGILVSINPPAFGFLIIIFGNFHILVKKMDSSIDASIDIEYKKTYL